MLAVTMGDPAGIGPDLTIAAWLNRASQRLPPFFVAGPASIYRSRAASLGLAEVPVAEISSPEEARAIFSSALPCLFDERSSFDAKPGVPDPILAPSIIQSIEQAVTFALSGRVAAMVTNPIAKHLLMKGGFSHPGHTEFLAELAERGGHPDCIPIMLMASEGLMAVPVTVHIPLKDVPIHLTAARLKKTAEITSRDFSRYFGVPKPRIAVCGLNPHAGEEGALGREEIEIIAPAIAELKSQGLAVSGPHSADTLFHEEARKTYDVALAMYHDQALIPFKTLSFYDGVNVTLGLPFIRTSPDHGTAYNLAGTGRANPASLIAAIKLAERMHRRLHDASKASTGDR